MGTSVIVGLAPDQENVKPGGSLPERNVSAHQLFCSISPTVRTRRSMLAAVIGELPQRAGISASERRQPPYRFIVTIVSAGNEVPNDGRSAIRASHSASAIGSSFRRADH